MLGIDALGIDITFANVPQFKLTLGQPDWLKAMLIAVS
jgi:hypothetical protein